MPPANHHTPAEGRFRGAFEHAPQPGWFADLELRLTDVNEALCHLLGRQSHELLGRNILDFTGPKHRSAAEHDASAMLAGTLERYAREHRLLRPDGQPAWALFAMRVVAEPSGAPAYVFGQATDVTEHRLREQRLRHLADHDPLTGLLNRRGFTRELRRHVSRLKRYGAKGALVMLDVDNFKAYNDTNGHAAGDELLCAIGTAIAGRLRAGDVVARLGGDEFAALLPEATPEQAETVAAALLESVRAAGRDRSPRVSASAGVFSFERGESLELLSDESALVAADLAMYAAKNAGRDRHVADSSLDIRARMADDVGGRPDAGRASERGEGAAQWPSVKRYQPRY